MRSNGPLSPLAEYWYSWTHSNALEKSRRTRHYRRQRHLRLLCYVEDKLKLQWSPEEIAQRIRMNYPNNSEMRVSHETIYRWGYLDASVEGNLSCNLRRRRKRRLRQKRYGAGRRFLSCRKSITERPGIGEGQNDLVTGRVILLREKRVRAISQPLWNAKAVTFWPPSWKTRGRLTLRNKGIKLSALFSSACDIL